MTDGLTTTSGTVLLTITADNDAPTISGIANLNLNEDEPSGTINFTVGDEETVANLLTVSATSNNQSLIADGAIVLGGTAANRTLSFTPVANASGGPGHDHGQRFGRCNNNVHNVRRYACLGK